MTSVELQYRVEAIVDSLAAHLLDRTGRDVSIEEFDTLTQELSERIGDLVQELVWSAPCRTATPIGRGENYDGEGRELEGLSPEPESRRRSR